jgi:hypothetical protein
MRSVGEADGRLPAPDLVNKAAQQDAKEERFAPQNVNVAMS